VNVNNLEYAKQYKEGELTLSSFGVNTEHCITCVAGVHK